MTYSCRSAGASACRMSLIRVSVASVIAVLATFALAGQASASGWKTDGVDDKGQFDTLDAALQASPTAGHTVAWMGRRNETANWTGLTSLATSGATVRMSTEFTQNDGLYFDTPTGHVTTDGSVTVTNTNTYIFVVTRPAGTGQTARYHLKNLTTGTVTRGNFTGTLNNGSSTGSTGKLWIGTYDGVGDFANAWHGLVGIWDTAMSDAQVDELWANKRTSDWYNDTAGTPTFLTELTSSTPTDLTGSASFVSYNGTVDAAETFAGWNFNGTGGEGPRSVGGYGMPFAGDGLANMQIGNADSKIVYRFRAEASFTLSSVRVYFITGPGYSAGNGGWVKMALQADDGTANHRPSGTDLASVTITDPDDAGSFRTLTLTSSYPLTAGTLYHLVFTNPYSAPVTNFTSIDDIGHDVVDSPVQPLKPDLDLMELYQLTDGSWTVNTDHTPIFTLIDSLGAGHGPGAPYVNGRSVSYLKSIGGVNQVAEIMTPTSNVTVAGAYVRVYESGTAGGALTISLQTSGGTVLGSGTVPASSINANVANWVGVSFTAVTLAAGSTYRLVLSAPAGTGSYKAFPLTEGDSAFTSPWKFTDGNFQHSTNSGAAWTSSVDDDAQFYLPLSV